MKETTLAISKCFDCDVLVVGGGVAGFAAAISAARNGAKTMIVEKNGCLGGNASSGLVGPFMSAMDPKGKKQVIYGVMQELIDRMAGEGGAIPPKDCKGGDGYSAYRIRGHVGVTPFSAESLKRIMEQMCLEAGVKIIYHLLLVKTDVSSGRIINAYFATKNGIYCISANVFIDCTGDADLSALSGVPILSGYNDGELQVSSLFFMIDGIDQKRIDQYMDSNPDGDRSPQRYFEKEIEEGKKNGTFPCGRHRISLFRSVENIWRVNMTQVDRPVNAIDPEDVSAAEIECRTQIPKIVQFLKKHVPGCENIRLLTSAEMLGLRESNRIAGEYLLTQDDVLNSTNFPDAIVFGGDSIDIHKNDKSVYLMAEKPFQIPYRCLLPQKVDNLVVAGRCLSSDRVAHSAVRVMPPCFAMGQAAGTAAAIAVRYDCSPKKIDVSLLRRTLKEQGAYLE